MIGQCGLTLQALADGTMVHEVGYLLEKGRLGKWLGHRSGGGMPPVRL